MSDKNDRIAELLHKYIQKGLSELERLELEEWKNESLKNQQHFAEVTNTESLVGRLVIYQEGEKSKEENRNLINWYPEKLNEKAEIKEVSLYPYTKKWVLAAASIILILTTGIIYWFSNNHEEKRIQSSSRKKDLAPGGNKAILTLANGQRVFLDNAQAGNIDSQGTSLIAKLDSGQITYKIATRLFFATPEITFNTLETPPAGQFKVTLQDGTEVWLNNASSLRYPTAFTGKKRQVELSGEGFFRVAHNPQKPFHVVVGGMDVAVIGTSFNIMSYSNETTINTTLVDGAVKVAQSGRQALLEPGEQAQLDKQGTIKKMHVNTGSVIAWTKGFFNFSHTDFQAALRQLARWYDIDIVYKGAIPHQSFSGVIDRQLSLSQVLKIFESDEFHLTIDGKSLIVSTTEN